MKLKGFPHLGREDSIAIDGSFKLIFEIILQTNIVNFLQFEFIINYNL